jgi:hypothetical protein
MVDSTVRCFATRFDVALEVLVDGWGAVHQLAPACCGDDPGASGRPQLDGDAVANDLHLLTGADSADLRLDPLLGLQVGERQNEDCVGRVDFSFL